VAFVVYAESSPSLGLATTFSILSGTYVNTTPGTALTGDLGYTTGPAVTPTVGGSTYTADSTYNQAGIDQGTALTALNNQPCTYTFPDGAVDLSSNLDFPTGTYSHGVYCVIGAASIGTGGITLNGTGTFIFRMTGALTTVANSTVTPTGGASACSTWWTPVGATTLGANSGFFGTIIDDGGITIGSTVTWLGRALSFGGTVTTDIDTLTAPTCAAPPTPHATLTLTKIVVNDNGGTKIVSDFPLYIGSATTTSGVASTTLNPGSYTVHEATSTDYASGAWTGDCAADGTITLADGDVKSCSITNNDIAAAPLQINTTSSSTSSSSGGGSRSSQRQSATTTVVAVTQTTTTSTASMAMPIAASVSFVPTLPNTGFAPGGSATPYIIALVTAVVLPIAGVIILLYIMRRKRVA